MFKKKLSGLELGFLWMLVSMFVVLDTSAQAQNQKDDQKLEIQAQLNQVGASHTWWSQVQENLAAQEYHLKPEENKEEFRAFNRKNQLTGQLSSGEMTLAGSPDSGSTALSWQAHLRTHSIVFDHQIHYWPSNRSMVYSDDEKVEFHHAHFTEQYINNRSGLRQNFIVHEGPSCDEIRVELILDGLQVEKRNNTELAFYDKQPKGGLIAHVLYKDLHSWDALGRK